MLRLMQFCKMSKFADCRFTLVFKGADGFSPRFCERFSSLRTQAATMAKYEHPCSKSFCSVESIHRPTRYSVLDFSTLGKSKFLGFVANGFLVEYIALGMYANGNPSYSKHVSKAFFSVPACGNDGVFANLQTD